jgi:hypothetical protein
MTEITTAHSSIQQFMARQGIEKTALRSDGRLSLTIDEKYRIHLRPASDGRLALQAKVAELPGAEGSRAAEEAIERLLNLSAGMLREHASTLSLEPHGHTVQLQSLLAAETRGAQLEAEIAEFTNALDFWVRTSKSL